MDTHRLYSVSNYLLGEDLILEISLPELQTMIKKYCPEFPEQTLKGLTDAQAKAELVNMANAVRAITDPSKTTPIKTYNNALPFLNSLIGKKKFVSYPYPKTAADLDKKPEEKKPDPIELTDEVKLLHAEIRQYCPKFPDEILDELRTVDTAKNEIVRMGTAVYKAESDPEFPLQPTGYGSSSRFLKKYVEKHGKVSYPYPETRSIVSEPSDKSDELIPFPGNNELLVKYYNHTVDLGWPGLKIAIDQKTKKIIPQKDGPAYIPFSLYYKGKTDKDTNEVVPYNMPKLVNKAKSLVDNMFQKKGLKKFKELKSAVENIIEADKKYKMSHKVHFKDKFAKFVSGLVRVLGGNEADEKVMNWLIRRTETMTVFEFQKLILDEVFTKRIVTSESGVRLSQITAIVRKGLDNKDFILSGIKGNSWTPGEAWFKIENARKISPITVEHAVKPMIFYLMSLREMVTEREFLKEFDEVPTIEEIDSEMKKIKTWAADPKNDEKKYTYGSDDDVLTCRKNKNGENTELRPVFNERAGVSVYISFSKDSEE